MRLLEFQAKRLLAEQDIPVPHGIEVRNVSELNKISYPVVLKAQVPVGGRSKAGAIQCVSSMAEAEAAANKLLSMEVKGNPVNAILAEEIFSIEKEYYIACLGDGQLNRPLIIASTAGGVNVEVIAMKSPDKLVKRHVDPLVGLQEFDIRALAKALAIAEVNDFAKIIEGIWNIFRHQDATLVEINPMAQTSSGLMALDAKIVLDDKAAFRHAALYDEFNAERQAIEKKTLNASEALARERGITYVPLDGNIGIIADGAGTGMLTVDMVNDMGQSPSNFCEMGGIAAEKIARQAMEVVLADQRIKVLLISLIGGMTRMDEIAKGIAAYVKEHGMPRPIVARMCGTKADVGISILKEIGVHVFEDLAEAVETAVRIWKIVKWLS
jgi:succinyl-CoA synthetase beta subunit